METSPFCTILIYQVDKVNDTELASIIRVAKKCSHTPSSVDFQNAWIDYGSCHSSGSFISYGK